MVKSSANLATIALSPAPLIAYDPCKGNLFPGLPVDPHLLVLVCLKGRCIGKHSEALKGIIVVIGIVVKLIKRSEA